MNPLTWQNPGQLFVAQDVIKINIYSVAELRNIRKYGNLFAWNIGKYANSACRFDFSFGNELALLGVLKRILHFTLHLFAWNPDKHWNCGGEGWLPRLHHSSPPFTRCGKPLFLDASRNGLLCYVLAVFLLLEYDFLQQLFHNQTLICLQRYGFYRNLQEKLWFCSFWMNDFVKLTSYP